MKKVLFVISSLAGGGAERALSNIICHFPEDWDIDILLNDAKAIDYPFRGNILTLNIAGKQKRGSFFFQYKTLLKRIKKLRKLKKKGNYCACISFKESANIANIISGRKYCRVVVSVRVSLLQSTQLLHYKYVINPLVRLLYNSADKVVAVSKGIEEEMKMSFHIKNNKVLTVENGYNLAYIQQQGREELMDEESKIIKDKIVIATMGRLLPQKGQWHLIRAFAKVAKCIPNVLLIIIGAGKLEEYLKQLIQEYEIDNQVYFTGKVSNPYKYLSRADIFAFPSLYEGFPNALAEAVCLGLPCIATDFRTGAREILAPDMVESGRNVEAVEEVEYGILTPVCSGKQYTDCAAPLEQSEKYLAEAIVMLLMDKEKRDEYRKKSRLRSETLGIDKVVNEWLELIDNDL